VDLYSAFIEVPHTQGAQVQITQCYLQITPYLPLPRKHSPDGASPNWGCGHLIAAYYSFIYPKRMKGWVGHKVSSVMCISPFTHSRTLPKNGKNAVKYLSKSVYGCQCPSWIIRIQTWQCGGQVFRSRYVYWEKRTYCHSNVLSMTQTRANNNWAVDKMLFAKFEV